MSKLGRLFQSAIVIVISLCRLNVDWTFYKIKKFQSFFNKEHIYYKKNKRGTYMKKIYGIIGVIVLILVVIAFSALKNNNGVTISSAKKIYQASVLYM